MANDTSPFVVVKWKYREVSPGKKNHTIDNYINYIEKQVEERRNDSGNFSLSQDAGELIGNTIKDNERIRERLASTDKDTWEQAQYLNYINERKGSDGCFSDGSADISKLMEGLKMHEGAVWIPIVSMKEKDAMMMGLDTEAAWMAKARVLAEEYRKTLNIDKENFHWLAAFHTKPESDQNRDADAGAMPHIHFIIWEDKPIIRRYALEKDEIAHIRSFTASTLSKEYMQASYKIRNELRSQIIEGAEKSLENYIEDVKSLIFDIRAITNGKGKMTVGDFEKTRDITSRILTKIENNKSLSEGEKEYMKKFNMNSSADVKRILSNYMNILEKLEAISKEALSRDEVSALVDSWKDISKTMRRAQGLDLSTYNTEKDFKAVTRVIQNSILSECKKAQYDNRFITPALRGMLIDKIEHGVFKRSCDADTFTNSIKTITALCKAVGMPEEECFKYNAQLLERSDMERLEPTIAYEIKKRYEEELALYLDITTQDYWNAMKAIQTPVASNFKLYTSNANGYELANSIVYKPVIKTFANSDLLRIVTASNSETTKIVTETLGRAIEDSTPVITRDDYIAKYNDLINEFTTLNQSQPALDKVR